MKATTMHIRTMLLTFDTYISTCDNTIIAFNEHMMILVCSLQEILWTLFQDTRIVMIVLLHLAP